VLSPQDGGRGCGDARHPGGHRAVSLLLRVASAAHGAGEARDHPAMTCPMMLSLGVYVLGAANTAERLRLEAHLPGCRECQADLNRLAPLPGLLAAIPESIREVTPSPSRPTRLPRRALAPGGARQRWAAAAAAGFVAAGVSSGLWLS